jgi:hypothetical protein
LFGAISMNWLALVVVGGAAAWFEYNYQRSRRSQKRNQSAQTKSFPVPETAHVERVGDSPSISPGAENDKKLNTTA